MTSASARPSARTDCWGRGGEAGQPLGMGVFGQFSLAGNRVATLHLATRVFLTGNHIGEEQQDKKQKRAREKRRRNRDKTLIYSGWLSGKCFFS